jgi:hypothetical protein
MPHNSLTLLPAAITELPPTCSPVPLLMPAAAATQHCRSPLLHQFSPALVDPALLSQPIPSSSHRPGTPLCCSGKLHSSMFYHVILQPRRSRRMTFLISNRDSPFRAFGCRWSLTQPSHSFASQHIGCPVCIKAGPTPVRRAFPTSGPISVPCSLHDR